MSTKRSRSGGKFRGSHTTAISAATIVMDIAAKQEEVTKVTPGYINVGSPSAKGKRKVKIIRTDSHVLLSVQDNAVHQDVHVYTNNQHVTVLAIARGARDAGLAISFGKM